MQIDTRSGWADAVAVEHGSDVLPNWDHRANELAAFKKATVISLLWLCVGGLVGAAVGLVTGYMSNRAAHNVWRISGRLRRRP